MRHLSQTSHKSSSAAPPRTWAKSKDNARSTNDRATDPFGFQSENETPGEMPTGGFSILDTPMPLQAQPEQTRDDESIDSDLDIQAKCDRCEAEDSEI